MGIIVDTIDFRPLQFERASGDKRPKVRGVFGIVEEPTRNKRIYRRSLMEREIERLKPLVEQRKLFGELDHPPEVETKLQRVSHLITALWIEGNRVYGEAELLDTPAGKIAAAIFEAGGSLGVSSRGAGTTRKREDGLQEVNDDYELISFDFVASPAAVQAWPSYVREEFERLFSGKEEKMATGTVHERAERLKREDPALYEEIAGMVRAEMRAQFEAEKAQAIAALKGELQEKLASMLEERKAELEKAVREEVQRDPSLAGAKAALSEIRAVLAPFITDEDTKRLLRAKDAEIRAVQREAERAMRKASREVERASAFAAEAEEKLMRYAEAIEEVIGVAEELAKRLHLERKLSVLDEEDREAALQLVGDTSQYATLEELDRAVTKAARLLHEQLAEEMRREEEVQKLQKEKARLEKALAEALALSRDAIVRAYFEQRIAKHPHAPALRKAFESVASSLKDEADVDTFIARWEAEHPLSEGFRRVRSEAKRTRMDEDARRMRGSEIIVAGVPIGDDEI